MQPTGIDGAWIFTPRILSDSRGSFLEWFRAAELVRVARIPARGRAGQLLGVPPGRDPGHPLR